MNSHFALAFPDIIQGEQIGMGHELHDDDLAFKAFEHFIRQDRGLGGGGGGVGRGKMTRARYNLHSSVRFGLHMLNDTNAN